MPPAARSSAATALACVALAAGCLGGGSGQSSGRAGGDGPSRSQFSARAVAICQRYQRRIGSLTSSTDLAHLAAQGRRAVALERAELRELRALTPPAADRTAVDRLFSTLEGAIGTGDKLVAAAGAQDAAGVAADAELLRAQLAATARLARPFGLNACAR